MLDASASRESARNLEENAFPQAIGGPETGEGREAEAVWEKAVRRTFSEADVLF